MEITRKRKMLLTVFVWWLLVSTQMAQGLKCYECYSCKEDWTGVEKDCDEAEDLCGMSKDLVGGWINRFCSRKGTKSYAENYGAKCDDYGSTGQKWCFCDTDLCNEMLINAGATTDPSMTITGYSIFAYFLFNLFVFLN